MSALSVVGGLYTEKCIQPLWDAIYGSGGRGAAAASSLAEVELFSYVPKALHAEAEALAGQFNFALRPTPVDQAIAFDYLHPLSTPSIWPALPRISPHPPIAVHGDVVLRYGMLEGDAVVKAMTAIYDPQSAFDVARFEANGSAAEHLAVVLNRYEAQGMVGASDPAQIASRLLNDGAEVVVVKMGGHGAYVAWHGGHETVPVYQTSHVWKIGTGDVFSATFAALWGVHKRAPAMAADLASRATADYCNRRQLPVQASEELASLPYPPVKPGRGQIYLAGPFFDLAQRWLVEETHTILRSMGAEVFSPVHAVGPGPAEIVAPADIAGLDNSDVVFAIMNGLDPGTIFEVGYAVRKGIPVIAFAENIKEEDLKMLAGTGCEIVDDYTSAIYRAIWKLPPA